MPLIGFIEVSIRLYGVHSLKGKRSIVRPLQSKLVKHFNCAVVESDMHDSHDVAVLSAVSINTNSVELSKTLDRIESVLSSNGSSDITVSCREIIHSGSK